MAEFNLTENDFISNDIDKIITPDLPEELIEKFSKLTHFTSLESAKDILRSGLMSGGDTCGCTAFGLNSCLRSDLARHNEVLMKFDWSGDHKALKSTHYVSKTPWTPQPDVIYHLQTDKPLSEVYWQGNVYISNDSLTFRSLELQIEPTEIRFKFIFKLCPKTKIILKKVKLNWPKSFNAVHKLIDPCHYSYTKLNDIIIILNETYNSTNICIKPGGSHNL